MFAAALLSVLLVWTVTGQPLSSPVSHKYVLKWTAMPEDVRDRTVSLTSTALEQHSITGAATWVDYRDICRSVEDKMATEFEDYWICMVGEDEKFGAWVHYKTNRYIRFSLDGLQFVIFAPSPGSHDTSKGQEDHRTVTPVVAKEEAVVAPNWQAEKEELQAALERTKDEVAKHIAAADDLKQQLQNCQDAERAQQANLVERSASRGVDCSASIQLKQEEVDRLGLISKQLEKLSEEKTEEILKLREENRECNKKEGELRLMKLAIRNYDAERNKCLDEQRTTLQELHSLRLLSGGDKKRRDRPSSQDDELRQCQAREAQCQDEVRARDRELLQQVSSATDPIDALLNDGSPRRNEREDCGPTRQENVQLQAELQTLQLRLDDAAKERERLQTAQAECDKAFGENAAVKRGIAALRAKAVECRASLLQSGEKIAELTASLSQGPKIPAASNAQNFDGPGLQGSVDTFNPAAENFESDVPLPSFGSSTNSASFNTGNQRGQSFPNRGGQSTSSGPFPNNRQRVGANQNNFQSGNQGGFSGPGQFSGGRPGFGNNNQQTAGGGDDSNFGQFTGNRQRVGGGNRDNFQAGFGGGFSSPGQFDGGRPAQGSNVNNFQGGGLSGPGGFSGSTGRNRPQNGFDNQQFGGANRQQGFGSQSQAQQGFNHGGFTGSGPGDFAGSQRPHANSGNRFNQGRTRTPPAFNQGTSFGDTSNGQQRVSLDVREAEEQ